jgi:hypothetical protein
VESPSGDSIGEIALGAVSPGCGKFFALREVSPGCGKY